MIGCAACLDGEHKRCYDKTTCPCAIDWNHGLTKSGSVNDKGEIIFVNAKHSDDDRIDKVSKSLIEKYNFVTATESDTIYLHTGKIYDNKKAEAIIKEETEKRIVECTKHDTLEVIEKIKRKTFEDLKDFDSDPNLLTLENGIL
ncbi:MAG: hypothetical protein HOD60_10430, partial [Candidatus Nitrosopelagicus sp.]|nr:hypothetical protein [Candidatus Nitrosopelagicus sp.]